MNDVIVSVVTPTYNREKYLPELYNSLIRQVDQRFEWIVIDDGSTDKTENLIKEFQNENKIKITYFKKINHGKHTALNASHQYINGLYVVVVDSDDILIDAAIFYIIQKWDRYKDDNQIACITFQKKYKSGKVSDTKIKGEYISTYEREFYKGFRGDHCEVFRKERFTSRSFPVFEKERFMAEGAMWYLISKEYKVVYTDMPIYLCEYLQDGLTKNIRIVMAKNPQGAYWNALQLIHSKFGLKMKLKNGILAIYYGQISGKENRIIIRDINNWFIYATAYIPALLIDRMWRKYLPERT